MKIERTPELGENIFTVSLDGHALGHLGPGVTGGHNRWCWYPNDLGMVVPLQYFITRRESTTVIRDAIDLFADAIHAHENPEPRPVDDFIEAIDVVIEQAETVAVEPVAPVVAVVIEPEPDDETLAAELDAVLAAEVFVVSEPEIEIVPDDEPEDAGLTIDFATLDAVIAIDSFAVEPDVDFATEENIEASTADIAEIAAEPEPVEETADDVEIVILPE